MEYKSKKEIESAIRAAITTDPKKAVKAMLRIFEYQTEDEQKAGDVVENNGA